MVRVTQSMLSSNMLRNLNTSYGKMSKMQDQLTSGKIITRASDDPVVAVKGMKYRTQIDKVEQFKRNTNEMNAWLDTTDDALSQVGDVLNRVKELVVQAANDTNTADDRAKIKAEIDQIREQLRDVANTKVGEKSIFTGTNTQKPLFIDVSYYDPNAIQAHYDSLTDPDKTQFLANLLANPETTLSDAAINPPIAKISERILNTEYTDLKGDPVNQFDKIIKTFNLITNPPDTETVSTVPSATEPAINSGTEEIRVEVFDGIQLTANFPGADIFGRVDELMQKVSDALDPEKNPNHDNIQTLLGGVADPTGVNKKDDLSVLQGILLSARAEVGARQNRLELMEHRLDLHEINVTKQMSNNEDTDYAETITKMTTQESIHQAALSVGSKIIQQTLVDFMR